MANDKSPHILNTSSNLLGICFIVLTSLKVLNIASKTVIDEIALIAMILFMASCFLSFISLRESKNSDRLEKMAEYVFLSGLALLFVTTLLFSFDFIQ